MVRLYKTDGLYYLTEKSNASYTYGANGLRKSKTVGSTVTGFIWNGQNLAAETNGSTVKNVYSYGPDGIQCGKINGSDILYVKDAHGNTVTTLNGSKGSIRDYIYDAFGNQLSTVSSSDTNPFRYCGEYYDKETDNIYLRARYYDSSTGRFISEDPVKDGLNWYVYCENDGINNTDSSGLKINGKRTSYELGYINEQIMKVIANKAAYKKAEITGGSNTYMSKLSSWASEERTALLDYMNYEFKDEGLARLVNEKLEVGAYTTIEDTSALLCVVAYYRNELNKDESDRDLSYDKLSSVFKSARKNNLLYYVDTKAVDANQVLDDYFYPLESSQGVSGNKQAYDSKNKRTIYARTAYPVDDQDNYQYAPDSL